MDEALQFQRACLQLTGNLSKLGEKQTQQLRSIMKLIHELVVVLPGPLESVTSMKKTSINLPIESLPQSYARVLCVLKNSDKEYMKDSDAFDSFLCLSMLHFVLVERARSRRDMQFLSRAYREVFQCRKIAAMLQTQQRKIVLCKLYAELVDLKLLLIEIDFNRLGSHLDSLLKECWKLAEKLSQAKIPISQLMTVRVMCLEALADSKYEAQCYRLLRLREEVIESFKDLFCRVSLEKYVRHTLELANRLVSSARSGNWLVSATYHKYAAKLVDRYCNTSYLSENVAASYLQLQKTTKASGMNEQIRSAICAQLKDYEQPHPAKSEHRKLVAAKLTITDIEVHRDSRSLLELTTEGKRTLMKAVVTSNRHTVSRPKSSVKVQKNARTSFSYSCLKKTVHRNSSSHLEVILDSATLQSQLDRIIGRPKQRVQPGRGERTSIFERHAVERKVEYKRHSRESRTWKRSYTRCDFEELDTLRFVRTSDGCPVWLQLKRCKQFRLIRTIELRYFDRKHDLSLFCPSKAEVSGIDDPSVALARVRNEVESSPFYSQFIHRMESTAGVEHNLPICHEYLSSRNKEIGESRLKLFVYLQEHLYSFVQSSYRLAVRISGRTFEKWLISSDNQPKHTKELKDLLDVMKNKEMRVPCQDIFKQKRKENLSKLIREILQSRMILSQTMIRRNGDYCIETTQIESESLKQVKVVNKKLSVSGVETVDKIYEETGRRLIREDKAGCLSGEIFVDYLLHKEGMLRTRRLGFLKQTQTEAQDVPIMRRHYPPAESIDVLDEAEEQFRMKIMEPSILFTTSNQSLLRRTKSCRTGADIYYCHRYLPVLGYCFLSCSISQENHRKMFKVSCEPSTSSRMLLLALPVQGIAKHFQEVRTSRDTRAATNRLAEAITIAYVYTCPRLAIRLPESSAVIVQHFRRRDSTMILPAWRVIARAHVKTPCGHSLVVTVSFNTIMDLWQLAVYERYSQITKLGYLRSAIQQIVRSRLERQQSQKTLWKRTLTDQDVTTFCLDRDSIVINRQTVMLSQILLRETIRGGQEVQFFKSQEQDPYIFQLILDYSRPTVYYNQQPIEQLRREMSEHTHDQRRNESDGQFSQKMAHYLASRYHEDKMTGATSIDKKHLICQRRCLKHIVASEAECNKLDMELVEQRARLTHNQQQWKVILNEG